MKTRILAALAIFCFSAVFAAGPEKITDINAALEKAKAENKMIFLQYGREACGNCQALKSYVKSHDLRLSESKFVYADVNCDDPATSKLFREKFKVSGGMLPFVVVAGPDGTQLASRAGYGTVKEYEDLLRDAQKALKK
ncbi:hypothetical protein BH11VER1_BH11VER1_07280 [soil metagenome]